MSASLYGLTLDGSGDLYLDDGELYFSDGPLQALQEIGCRLDFFLGEYFLDTSQGIPYYRDILIKAPNGETIKSLYRRTILSVPGMAQISKLEYSLDRKRRVAYIEWEAFWIDGQPLDGKLELNLGKTA